MGDCLIGSAHLALSAMRFALCALIPFRYVKSHKKPKTDLTFNPDPTKIITGIRCPSGEIFPLREPQGLEPVEPGAD
jgi:hypothetical protein